MSGFWLFWRFLFRLFLFLCLLFRSLLGIRIIIVIKRFAIWLVTFHFRIFNLLLNSFCYWHLCFILKCSSKGFHPLAVFDELFLIGGQIDTLRYFFSWNHIKQEIKGFIVCYDSRNIIALKCFSSLLLCIISSLVSYFCDKHLASQSKQYWRFRRNHAYIFIWFHYLFDTSKRKLLIFKRIQVTGCVIDVLSNFFKLCL